MLISISLTLLAAAAPAPAVTVVIDAPEPAASSVRAELAHSEALPVRLQLVPVPSPAAPPAAPVELDGRLADARRAWVNADFQTCAAALDADTARAALADGRRALAARWLVWRGACLFSQGRLSDALSAATQLAVWELEPPADLGAVTPDIERLFVDAARAVSAQARAALSVTGPAGAQVSVDGRPGVCSVPCRVNVLPGAHAVRSEAAGFEPVLRWEEVSAAGASLTLASAPASSQLALAQWAQKYLRSREADSQESLKLLGTGLQAHRLIWLAGDATRLVGVLAVGGSVVARLTRDDGALALVRDLLVQGSVVEPAPPLYKRPVFWLVVGAVAVAAATVTAVLLTRDVRSSVSFQ